jgi:hypothetical protein
MACSCEACVNLICCRLPTVGALVRKGRHVITRGINGRMHDFSLLVARLTAKLLNLLRPGSYKRLRGLYTEGIIAMRVASMCVEAFYPCAETVMAPIYPAVSTINLCSLLSTICLAR